MIPLIAGAGAGLAAYMGLIPGVGGKPDPAAIVKGATTVESLRSAQDQINQLNTAAMQRAALVAAVVAGGAFMLQRRKK